MGKPEQAQPDSLRTGFAARLRVLCEEKKLSNKKLAIRARVSEQTVSRLKTGSREPGLTVLVCLADALGVTLDALVGRSPPPVCNQECAYLSVAGQRAARNG